MTEDTEIIFRECHAAPPTATEDGKSYSFPITPSDQSCGEHVFNRQVQKEIVEKAEHACYQEFLKQGNVLPQGTTALSNCPPHIVQIFLKEAQDGLNLDKTCESCIYWYDPEKGAQWKESLELDQKS